MLILIIVHLNIATLIYSLHTHIFFLHSVHVLVRSRLFLYRVGYVMRMRDGNSYRNAPEKIASCNNSMGCLSSKDGEHSRSPTSTRIDIEETSFTESEAHAQMIIDVRDGQVEAKDCLQGLERDLKEEKVEGGETERSEIEAQLTSPTETTTTNEFDATQSGARRFRPTAKSVTVSIAESKGQRYWEQDLKG